jgi:hypothetical protein
MIKKMMRMRNKILVPRSSILDARILIFDVDYLISGDTNLFPPNKGGLRGVSY